jgi:hypothetical protein
MTDRASPAATADITFPFSTVSATESSSMLVYARQDCNYAQVDATV